MKTKITQSSLSAVRAGRRLAIMDTDLLDRSVRDFAAKLSTNERAAGAASSTTTQRVASQAAEGAASDKDSDEEEMAHGGSTPGHDEV